MTEQERFEKWGCKLDGIQAMAIGVTRQSQMTKVNSNRST